MDYLNVSGNKIFFFFFFFFLEGGGGLSISRVNLDLGVGLGARTADLRPVTGTMRKLLNHNIIINAAIQNIPGNIL